MHILKVIHGYPPNYNAGSEVYSQSICNELARFHKVSVFTREENLYAADFDIRHSKVEDNLDMYYLNNPQGKDGYRHAKVDANFAELVHTIKPDIAHIGHLNHLSTGIVEELFKKKIPIVFTLHDFWLMCPRGQFLTRNIGLENKFQLCGGQQDQKCATDCYRAYFSGIERDEAAEIQYWSNWVHTRMDETRSIINKIDLFIAPSQYLRTRFIKDFLIPQDKIIYLDYGFPLEYLTPANSNCKKDKFTFGYIGTHIPSKGVQDLIQAFTHLNATANLRIYGRENGQNTAALKSLCVNSQNSIEFAGEYINHNLANDVFSKVDCIVVPSIWAENSPLVIHEAQACKIPVITADFGGMKEYVKHKVNGLLFEHRNPESLTAQMMFACSNPDLMKEYGKRGYLSSDDGQVPNIKDHCNELVNIYKRLKVTKHLWRITIDTNPEDCNLKCLMCEEHSPYSDFIPRLFQETGVKRRRMQLDTVESIFRQAAELGIKEIIPSTMGEPLLYKGIEEVFKLSRKYGIKINLTTNGTFPKLKIEDWAKMIVPNTTDIKISLNGASAETAEKIMIGLDFNQVMSNIKSLISFRDKYFDKSGYYCRISFQLTFMQNNMHELADIIKMAANLGVDRVKGHQLWTHFDEIADLSMKATSESISNWNNYVKQAYEVHEKYRKPNGEKVILENISPIDLSGNSIVPDSYECPFLSKELWVSATGKISPCCAPDKLRKTLGDFGEISSTTFQDVLNSDLYQNLVRDYKKQPLCQTCVMRKPIIS
jgi:glycosyltransferase involved in cell wall biosynthesis/MoaA/NifB/PqqE/SkfB family radical SAM enzyme